MQIRNDKGLPFWEKSIDTYSEQLLSHIKEQHHGFPVQNCHTCGMFVGWINNAKTMVEQLRHT
jgi:hypothetical protein